MPVTDAGGRRAEGLIARGWELHDIQVTDLPLVDLTAEGALDHVGLEVGDILDDDWDACQAVGEAAHSLGFAGVAAPSATRAGVVIAAFETRLQPARISVIGTRRLDATYLQ